MRKIPLLLLTIFALLSLSAAAERAGDDTCATCHEEQANAFGKTVHKHLGAFGRGASDGTCESCHGPGARHAESQSAADIVNPGKLLAAEASAACLTCHSTDRHRAFWDGSAHEAADLSCLSCHDVHDGPGRHLLRKSDPREVCLTCHGNVRSALMQRSRHPLREGLMDCASCHDAHGTPTEKLIDAASVNDKCYQCHADKRGPFLWEHFPVRENCLTCHASHGSNQESLLVKQTTRLCQSCHIQGRHQTGASKPDEVWLFNRACLNCHGQIHGSNHPSGVILQR